jgi:hypothetical protein
MNQRFADIDVRGVAVTMGNVFRTEFEFHDG